MRVAAIQLRPPKGQPAQARARITAAAEEAASAGAQLIVLPEMATTGYIWPDAATLMAHAEAATGPTSQALAEVALRHEAWIFCGFAELSGDRLFNSQAIIAPSGRVLRPYRKLLLYTADETWAEPGDERMVVETSHGLVAPGICMDLNDPGFIDLLVAYRPRWCAFSTNWLDEGADPLDYWRMLLRPWSGIFIAANTWGEDDGVRFCGLSAILGPDGEVLARAAPRGDQTLLVDV